MSNESPVLRLLPGDPDMTAEPVPKSIAVLALLVLAVGCAPNPGRTGDSGSATLTSTASASASPTPSTLRATRTTPPPRICGGYERPDLSAGECDLVNSGNLGLIQGDTCKTTAPSGSSTAAVECKGRGMEIFAKGQEPAVYVYGFADLQDLKDSFDSYATELGVAEGDVQLPPARGFWALADDPPETHRGQLMSRVVDGETLLIWTDWKELTWISAETSAADIKTLYSWWGTGNL